MDINHNSSPADNPGPSPEKRQETPEEKFVRTADSRLPRAITAIRNLGKLRNSTYRSTAAQRAYIVKEVETAVKHLKQTLNEHPDDLPALRSLRDV